MRDHPRDDSGEARVMRGRQQALRDALDREMRPHAGSARRLVQVYDAGKMPTQPDHFFSAHPLLLDGGEVEGGTGTPAVDTSTTLLVDFLSGVPTVGDLAVATLVGGRWVAEKSGQPPPKCLWWCGPNIFIAPPSDPNLQSAYYTAKATMTIGANGSVTSITLTYGGGGYAQNPAVVFGDGGVPPTRPAKAVAIVGQVASLALTNPGKGYDPAKPPNVTIAAPGGSGTQATATVSVDPATGSLTGLTLVDRGSLYPTASPTVTIDPPPPGPKAVQATAQATAQPGIVTSLILLDGGAGYQSNVPPPYLNATVACKLWSVPLQLFRGIPSPPDGPGLGEIPYCFYSGSTVFDFPATDFTAEVRGVTVKVLATYTPGSGWYVGVSFHISNDFYQQTAVHDCQGPSHPATPPINIAFDGDGIVFGVTASDAAVVGVGGFPTAGPGKGACIGRPYSGSVTNYIGLGESSCASSANGPWTYDAFVKSPYLYINSLYTLMGAKYFTLVEGEPDPYVQIPLITTLSEP